MKEEKKTFKEKWEDKKYQAKVKLSGYGIFIGVVILILLLGNNSSNNFNDNTNNVNNNINNSENNIDNSNDNKVIFNKPDSDNYSYEIEIKTKKDNNNNEYYYYGKVNNNNIELTKTIDNKEYKYKINNNKYYVLTNNNYILTTKEEVYNILDYTYLDIDNINNYLSYSKLIDNKYQIYLKDIILGNNSNNYITIEIDNNNLIIDYTNLINIIDDKIYEEYLVNIKYIED